MTGETAVVVTSLQRIIAAREIIFDVEVGERQNDFAETWRYDFVLLVLVVVVVLRVVGRADCAASSLECL